MHTVKGNESFTTMKKKKQGKKRKTFQLGVNQPYKIFMAVKKWIIYSRLTSNVFLLSLGVFCYYTLECKWGQLTKSVTTRATKQCRLVLFSKSTLHSLATVLGNGVERSDSKCIPVMLRDSCNTFWALKLRGNWENYG